LETGDTKTASRDTRCTILLTQFSRLNITQKKKKIKGEAKRAILLRDSFEGGVTRQLRTFFSW
jgi:hypothetical protein